MNNEPILLINRHIIVDGDMTGNLSSGVIDIAEVPGFCVHAIWTGTPVGNITIEGSNDGINFKAIVTQAAGGVSGQLLSNQSSQHYRYLEVNYTASSSVGVLNVYVSGKNR